MSLGHLLSHPPGQDAANDGHGEASSPDFRPLPERLGALRYVSAGGSVPRPGAPETLEGTGLDERFLLSFVLKAIYVGGLETALEIASFVALGQDIVEAILETAKERRLVQVLGLADERRSLYRYSLTDAGRDWAVDALEQCQYAGPAPVTLDAYRCQVLEQTIGADRVKPEAMAQALQDLALPEETVDQLGPAANSGKSILLYGAPGNGKTSIAEALGRAFTQAIYVPHCLEVGGQIIRVFDPALHEPCPETAADGDGAGGVESDPRWVRCRRPVIVTGGELTLAMLDLSFDPVSKFYEAPAHMKAMGGVFILDDFGRQRVRPLDLVNRWILPLDRRFDHLTLHTGKKLRVPFDELVVFSTNAPPNELLDAAALRRIPYKFHVAAPTRKNYEEIFRKLCARYRIALPGEVLPYLLDRFYPQTGTSISGAHPRFIVEHVLERCRFEDVAPRLTVDGVREAAQNLLIDATAPEVGSVDALRGSVRG